MNDFPIDLRMLLSFTTALVVAWIMIPPIVKVSRKKNLVALPNGRTSHDGAIPTLGGVAIFASVIIGSGIFMPDNYPGEFHFLVPAMVVLFFIGLQDDIGGLKPRIKLAGQLIASLIAIIGADIRISTLHGLLGFNEIPYIVSILITLVIFVGVINAFNMVDGIDGLASGLGIVISIVFGIWLVMLGRTHYAIFAFALAGSLIAFYRFNVFSQKYKLFMGDTGSMLIGFLFAIMMVKVLCCEVAPESFLHMKAFPVVAISLMILPISDTLRVMILRIMGGKSPFYADRTHCHHDLLRLGFSHRRASNALITGNLLLFFIALLLKNLPPFLLGLIMLVAGVFVCSLPVIWSRIVLRQPVQSEAHFTLIH